MRQQMISVFIGVSLGLAWSSSGWAAEKNAPSGPQDTPGAAALAPESEVSTAPSATSEPAPTVQPAPAAQAPAPAPVESPREKALKEWRAKLNGTNWALELKPSGGGNKKPLQDTLTFQDRQILSKLLSKDGYLGSNYTLTVQEDGSAIWETMQTKESGGVVFWRAEIQGDAMQGVLSKQPAEGATEEFSFIGHRSQGKMEQEETPAQKRGRGPS